MGVGRESVVLRNSIKLRWAKLGIPISDITANQISRNFPLRFTTFLVHVVYFRFSGGVPSLVSRRLAPSSKTTIRPLPAQQTGFRLH